MKNEKLTRELKQELFARFCYVAQGIGDLFELNGSIMKYAYEVGLVECGENGYEVYNHCYIDKLAKVDTTELIAYINTTYITCNLDNKLNKLSVAIELSIIANYWLRNNGNKEFFTFIYEALERSEMRGVVFAQELLMFGLI